MRDRSLIYVTAFLRALATGMIAVLIAIYLARLDFSATQIGIIIGMGLSGAASATLFATVVADHIGRRRFLIATALLATAGAVGVAVAAQPLTIGIAAFIGMVNGMGRDRTAAAMLEQAILPATASDAERTRAFAWYNVLQDAGHAFGGVAAGVPALVQYALGVNELTSMRIGVAVYAGLMLLTAFPYTQLSARVEVASARRLHLSPQTRHVLWRVSSLFALDAIAGGFLTTALLAFFFYDRFGVSAGTVGALFFAARVANAGSHIAAAWLAGRIGLVNTMVFTHIPSSLLLVTVAYAPNFPTAAVLFLLREGLVEMDVPTRQSYVMAVVQPEERTAAAGITQLVRICGWAIAPFFAAALMQRESLTLPLLVGAAMKIAYDIALYVAFRDLKPPEEGGAPVERVAS